MIDAQDRTVFLFKDSKVVYGKRNIKANTIDMDYKTNLITAIVGKDTTGKSIGVPVFEEGSDKYEAQQIKFNLKTKKGQVKQIVTRQGEGIIHGEVVKKQPDNTMYIENASYTTCDLREPHFCIKANKIKFVAGKKIFTKAFNLQLDDIPTILAFPFGIFPMTKKRASGIIIPSYVDNATRGIGILGGGFYWAVNQYVGVRATVDAYTNGGAVWNVSGEYKSRYAFQGNLSVSYTDIYLTNDNPSNRGNQQATWVRWTHSTINKGTGRLSASVNMGSSKFNQNTQYDIGVRNTGQFQSNVSYSNEIKKTPFNYGLNFRQSQDVRSGRMDMTLPEVSVNMRQIYPLREVPVIGKLDPVKKFNFRYSGTFSNMMTNFSNNYNSGFAQTGISTTQPQLIWYNGNIAAYKIDSIAFANDLVGRNERIKNLNTVDTLSFKDFFDKFFQNTKWNATHNIPFNTSIKVLKYFNLNPNATYRETWYDREYTYTDWNENSRSIGITEKRNLNGGLKRTYEYNVGASVTTRVYGTFYIKKLNIEAIRHTLNPTIGYTYVPDLRDQGEFKEVRVGGGNNRAADYRNFNRYTGVVGTPRVEQQNLTFSLTNQFEMKMRDIKDTTKVTYKKLMLLDNVNFSGNYDLKRDSFNLSNISMSARTKIALFDINFTTNLDPYYYQTITTTGGGDVFKTRSSFYDWNSSSKRGENSKVDKPFGLGQFVNMNLAISTSFRPKTGKKPRVIPPVADGTDYYFMSVRNMAAYIDWSVPWTLNVSYIMSYQRFTNGPNGTVLDRTIFANNISLSGDVSLTPKWKVNLSTAYDINKAQISTTRIGITRDLHCWQASFSYNIMPSFTGGATDAFIATIGIKSATLKDLKFDRRSQPF